MYIVLLRPGWCDSNILVCLVEERECLRVEGRGRSSCAKREPEGVPARGRRHTKREEERKKDKKLSERAKLTKGTKLKANQAAHK